MVKITTRKQTDVWLIGQPEKNIGGTKLPLTNQVVKRFFFHHIVEKKTIRVSARETCEVLCELWDKARIPHKDVRNATDVLVKLHARYVKLTKDRHSTSPLHESRREDFKKELRGLFDIAVRDVESKIKNPEDLEFYRIQRDGHHGCMLVKDSKLAKKEEKYTDRLEKRARFNQKHAEQAVSSNAIVQLEDSDEDGLQDVEAKDFEIRDRKKKKIDVTSEDVCAELDRSKTSNREATRVLAGVTLAFGQKVQDVNLSYSTIRRSRINNRTKVAQVVKEEFKVHHPLTVHWDGKRIIQGNGQESLERIAVKVTGCGEEKLLGAPLLPDGTVLSQARAVHQLLKDWNLEERVAAMGFDTTSSNTGNKEGAGVHLERFLNKELLWTACQHHVFELLLKDVYALVMGPSKGPTVLLFERFKKSWNGIDPEKYDSPPPAEFVQFTDGTVDPDEVIKFCLDQLQTFQPRADYKELAEIIVTLLGGVVPGGLKFRKPGAYHRARFMNHAIYSIKILLFSGQFSLTRHEMNHLKEVCAFVVFGYVKCWFMAQSAVCAPNNTLQYLKFLEQQEKTGKSRIWKAAKNKLSRHLWYLSPKLAALSFFDPTVPAAEKLLMSQALHDDKGLEEEEETPKKGELVGSCQMLELHDFISSRTVKFFQTLEVPFSFVDTDPTTWDSNEDYKIALHVVQQMNVVNDSAERGVKLMTEYSSVLTQDEEQVQALLHVVEKRRKECPTANKKDLMKLV